MRRETIRSRVCGKHTTEPWEPCPSCKDMTQAQKDDMLSLARDTYADEMFELVGNAPYEQWARINDALKHIIDANPNDVHKLTCHCGGCRGTHSATPHLDARARTARRHVPNLTREQILTMEAGPEMDTLISERVFGWNPKGETLFPYSTSIAAAWEVVDRIFVPRALHPGLQDAMVRLFRWDGAPDDPPWEARIGEAASMGYVNTPDFGDGVTATAPTAPLAICRAALLATLEPA